MVKNNSKSTIEIIFDPQSVSVHIRGVDVADSVWSQIYLLCSAGSENVDILSKCAIQLPWFEFRRILQPLAGYIAKENINVVYNDHSKKLISNHLHDSTALKATITGKISETLDLNNLKDDLSQTSFKRSLTEEQFRDTCRLITLKHGANFSVPGAGKTSTLLAVHSILRKEGKVSKLFVIAPRNAFISWEDEVAACFKESSPNVVRLTGGKGNIAQLLNDDPDIALITYQQLPIVVEDVISYLQRNLVHLVLDESHRIKRGMPGVYYSAVIKLADLAQRRDILTGTPMPQSTSDLGPQFDFLWPGGNVLGDVLGLSDEQKRIEAVNQNVKPLYVRTTKDELGLNPPKIKITNIELGPVQSELYELLRSETARVFNGMDREDMITFRKLGRHVMRLLQVASNPMLVTSNNAYDEEMSPIQPGTRKWELLSEFSRYEKPAKIEYTLKRVNTLCSEGHKVVVWSCFVQNIKLLETLLSNLGAVSIYGAIETGNENEIETREWRIRRFHNDPDCRVLIGNPAACGEGISLHKVCHYALYVDRTFNAAHYLQSVDRIHRLGLPPDVVTKVEILEANDTIDAVVKNRLGGKICAMGKVLDDPDLCAMAYDLEDIIEAIPAGMDRRDIHEIRRYLMGEK